MKRIIDLILTILILVFLTACKPVADEPKCSLAQPPSPTQAMETPEATQASPSGELTIGLFYEIFDDWEYYWNYHQMIHPNALVNALNTVTHNRNGEYIIDPYVVKSVDTSLDAEGNKTFTFEIWDDLKWSNGDPIRAEHFVASFLFFNSHVIRTGISGIDSYLAGYSQYKDGESDVFEGVRLLDEHVFSLTVPAKYLPYYHELKYVGAAPLSIDMWLGDDYEIKDDGEGAYIALNGEPAFSGVVLPSPTPIVDTYEDDMEAESTEQPALTAEPADDGLSPKIRALLARVEEARHIGAGRITAGPYMIEEFDPNYCVLTVNPYYKGNFEGQKPNIKNIVFKNIGDDGYINIKNSINAGKIDLLIKVFSDMEIETNLINSAISGELNYKSYNRSGMGKLQLQCDFGPTQFVKVRQALACLIDRNAYKNEFCGHGVIFNAPYCDDMWMYAQNREELETRLDDYAFDYDRAVGLLESDGWVLDEKGKEYPGEGIRYKEVTKQEAGNYEHNIKLKDGRILMPLIIERADTSSCMVRDYLYEYIHTNEWIESAGMKINAVHMDFSETLNYMYRDESVDKKYGIPKFGLYNLAMSYSMLYDFSYEYATEDRKGNDNYIFDEQLSKLAYDMVYSVEPGDRERFSDIWVEFIVRWNELLPDIPMYSNTYYDIHSSRLKDYDVNTFWDWSDQLLYCTVDEQYMIGKNIL